MGSFLDAITGLGSEAGRLAFWAYLALFAGAAALIFALGVRSRLMMSRAQRIALLVLRVATLLILVAALAQITFTRFTRSLSVTFLVDASQSISDPELARAQQFLDRAWARKGDVPVRVLAFDRISREVFPLEDSAPPVKRLSEIPGTEIAGALHASLDTFEDNTFKRAVLLSDGNETTGDLLGEAGGAKVRSVQVDVVPLATRQDRDIYIESINLPRRARTGERIHIAVTVISNYAVRAVLEIKRGEAVEVKKEIDVVPGTNTVDFDTTVKSKFNSTYTASVQADADDHPENNTLSALLRVVGNPRVLVFSGKPGADMPLIDALSAERLRVQAAPADQFPDRAAALNPFDLVVLSNVDFKGFGKDKVEMLEKFAGEYGGGVLVFGGEKSATEQETDLDKKRRKLPIENLLPALLKEKKKTEPNPVAMILIIDKSASMARQNKFGMAIRAAKDTIGLLTDRSKIGVILFDDFPRWAVPMQPAKDKQAIKAELDRFGVDGGTSIYPAVAEAYATLKPMSNKVKHVILLSDGYSITQFDQNAHLIQYMADKKITVSTVALGKESDKAHLRKIAMVGKGRFYYTEDINQIPKIFTEETKTITKTNIVEARFRPEVIKRGEMLRGVSFKSVPELYGYNAAKPKPTSEVFLTAEKKEPLLVRWRYGLGKVTFMATDTGADWARKWPEWNQYQRLVSNIARNTLGDQSRRTYRLKAEVKAENVEVTVDALDHNGNFINDLDLDLEVTSPGGDTGSVPLQQSRPGGYQGSFRMDGLGEYSFAVSGRDAASAATGGIGSIFLAPPTEFISQTTNEALLKKTAEVTKGRYEPTVDQIFEMPEERFPQSKPLWPYLLYIALGLFLVGVIVRRS